MELIIDGICGFAAGVVSGVVVAPIEYTKVLFQTDEYQALTRQQRMDKIFTGDYMRKVLKYIPFFSPTFGCVCGLEFSVNERVKTHAGSYAGIISSALTGATFLTVADHTSLRSLVNGQSPDEALKLLSRKRSILFSGFSPMVFREAIFISSVMYLGPQLGYYLWKPREGSYEEHRDKEISHAVGRVVAGMITSFMSQPFDCLTREFQKNALGPEKVTWYSLLKKAHEDFVTSGYKRHPLFKGTIPRMWLATTGGVLAGYCFEKFKWVSSGGSQ